MPPLRAPQPCSPSSVQCGGWHSPLHFPPSHPDGGTWGTARPQLPLVQSAPRPHGSSPGPRRSSPYATQEARERLWTRPRSPACAGGSASEFPAAQAGRSLSRACRSGHKGSAPGRAVTGFRDPQGTLGSLVGRLTPATATGLPVGPWHPRTETVPAVPESALPWFTVWGRGRQLCLHLPRVRPLFGPGRLGGLSFLHRGLCAGAGARPHRLPGLGSGSGDLPRSPPLWSNLLVPWRPGWTVEEPGEGG